MLRKAHKIGSKNTGFANRQSPIAIAEIASSCLKLISKALYFAEFSTSFAMADEEPVDQKKYFEDGCKPKCVKQLRSYEACVKRIQGDESGNKHCTGQYFDYWSCVDKCVAPSLFTKLK
ncbi:Cytochrome b-c1 complex subunit 6 [Gossypium arboreum]|uniref:Complex III subunit VI n=4 Tax=Gossypium TaxID=3633 RepID=A0A0B0MDT2_GOSAR|nr:Cytochrome b-c1 complex subunit 6 [Gossypium arboreum]